MRGLPASLISLAVLGWASPGLAVDGVVVNTRDGTDSLQYYGTVDGELWRHDIANDAVVSHTKIYNGPASRPAICLDGKHVAFVKKTGSAAGKVAVIDLDGSNEVLLADCLRSSLIDCPHEDWVYFTMGGFHDSSSGLLKRVNITTKTVETVMQVRGTDGGNTRVSQIQIAGDLMRAVVRTGDSESNPDGVIAALDLGEDDRVDQIIGTKYSCGAGLFADGVHAMDGWTGHDGFDIRRYGDAAKVKSFSNAAAFNWPPSSGSGDPVDTQHAIFNTGAATNSDRWMCIVTGGERNYKWHSMLLLNWKDERTIFVTRGLAGPWDHGDFWVGTPTVGDPPTITQHPSSTSVVRGETATFSVTAGGSGPLVFLWHRNGEAIAGATGPSHTTGALALTDTGDAYRCVVSNSHGSVTSAGATVTVSASDLTPPTLVAVSTRAGQSTEVKVLFSEALDEATAEAVGNYAIDQGVSVGRAALDAAGAVVTLSTSTLAAGSYTLSVTGVTDAAHNPIVAGSRLSFDYAEQAVNQAPAVSAGEDRLAFAGVPFTLVGSSVDDGLPADASVTLSWAVEPDDGTVSIAEPDQPVTTVTFAAEGSYTLSLTASDGALSASDSFGVVVRAPQQITLLSPTGGEQWETGSLQHIRWTTTNVDDVFILFSADEGETWQTIVPTVDVGDPNWGNYPFTTPDTPTEEARIRIEAYVVGEAAPPESDSFSIYGTHSGRDGGAGAADAGLDANQPTREGSGHRVALSGGCRMQPASLPTRVPWSLVLLVACLVWRRIRPISYSCG